MLEYQRDKAARDAAYEAEQEKKRQDREKEISRLRAKQERARDMQADKDALRAKREQERKEREWREKERLEAMKKRQIEEEMKLSREWQCRNKEHYLAVEAAKDRSEFQKVLKYGNIFLRAWKSFFPVFFNYFMKYFVMKNKVDHFCNNLFLIFR